MYHPNADPSLFAFPELPDEAVIAVNDFLEEFYTRFQNHYCAQMQRYEQLRPDLDRCDGQMPLPLSDPPF
jgi:hypothetical protein